MTDITWNKVNSTSSLPTPDEKWVFLSVKGFGEKQTV